MDIQIWIPAQATSQRIERKNIRPFYSGMSLLELKLRQLIKVVPADSIFVSSNSKEVEDVCGSVGVHYISRPDSLLGNAIQQADLFNHFLEETPDSEKVGWIQVTDPLFSDFEKLFSVEPQKDEVRVVATELKKHGFFQGRPINFQFGDWHEVTQDITPIMIPRWSGFFARRQTFRKFKYHFGKLNTFVGTDAPFVDIDYIEDFELAQYLYKKHHE